MSGFKVLLIDAPERWAKKRRTVQEGGVERAAGLLNPGNHSISNEGDGVVAKAASRWTSRRVHAGNSKQRSGLGVGEGGQGHRVSFLIYP